MISTDLRSRVDSTLHAFDCRWSRGCDRPPFCRGSGQPATTHTDRNFLPKDGREKSTFNLFGRALTTGDTEYKQNGRSDRRAPGLTESAICVQRLDDSLNSAIHTTYRSSLRSSSMHEPRGPPLEVILHFRSLQLEMAKITREKNGARERAARPAFGQPRPRL